MKWRNTLTHCLRHGLPLCDPELGPPGKWPPGHSWLNEEQFREGAPFEEGHAHPCEGCRGVLNEDFPLPPELVVLDEEELINSLPLPRKREPVVTEAKVRVFDSKEALARGIDGAMKARMEAATRHLGREGEEDGQPTHVAECKSCGSEELARGPDARSVRDHPNYQRPAFTLEEAERHATVHQTVGAFRMLRALHEAREQRNAALKSASLRALLLEKAPTLSEDEWKLVKCALHAAKHAWGDRPGPFKKQAGEAEALEERLEDHLDRVPRENHSAPRSGKPETRVPGLLMTEGGFDQDVWDSLSLFPAEVGRATITLLEELQAKRREVEELERHCSDYAQLLRQG